MATDQVSFNMVCNGCVEIAVAVAAGSPTVTVVDTNGTLGTVTAGNSQTFNDYLVNGNTATVSIPDGNTVASGKITGTIKYTVCPTPTAPPPTPSATIAPTPSPTPGGATPISGSLSCLTATDINAIGVANKYYVTLDTNTSWFNINVPKAVWETQKIYLDSSSDQIIMGWRDDNSCTDVNDAYFGTNWPSGNAIATLPYSVGNGPLSNTTTFYYYLILPLGSGTASYNMWIDN